MKKYTAILASVMVVLSLTGCGGNQLNLSDEQNNQVAEYLAGVMLKHSKNYDASLVYDSTPEPEATKAPSQSEEGTDIPNETGKATESPTKQVNSKLEEVFPNKNIKISYTSASLQDNYTEKIGSSSTYVNAGENKKLLLVKFNIQNKTNESQKLNLLKTNIQYVLKGSDGSTYNPVIAIITNDLQFYKETIKAKKSKTGMLIFKVEKNMKVDGSQLYVSNGGKLAKVDLK